jgi:hypothetical protein
MLELVIGIPVTGAVSLAFAVGCSHLFERLSTGSWSIK